jgi:hypothetical protein
LTNFRKIIFAILFILALNTASWAADPQNALSARPEASIYWAARVDDVGGILQSVLSPANIEMFTSLAGPEEAQGIRLAANLASQLPAKSVAFIVGMAEKPDIPFFQMAISMPERMRPRLDLVAQGKATAEDLVTLVLGEGGLMLAVTLEDIAVQKGPEGPYYVIDKNLDQSPVLAAKDNLLLVAFSPAELSASLAALEKKENRLAFKRRFESPNYYLWHMDVARFADLIQADPDMTEIDLQALKAYFKAPLDVEAAFDAKPGSFLVSGYANILEALKNTERWKTMKPAPGAGLFLAGGGRLLLGFSGVTAFKAEDWKTYSEFAKLWDKLLGELGKKDITEKDLENLLTGNISILVGSEASVMGKRAPGLYIALTGQEGVAAKIWGKVVEDEDFSQAVPLSPLKAEGWDSLFMVDPALVPASLVLGVSKDTFFLGIVDPKSLGKKPELAPEAAELFKKDLFGAGFFDVAGAWEYLRKETADPASNLGDMLAAVLRSDPGLGSLVKDLLDAELPISSLKMRGPDLETGFMELTLVDVPQEKRLLPKLVSLAAFANARASVNAEAWEIISGLRSLKAASMMFYADNVEDVNAGKADALIDAEGSATELLGKYTDNPEGYEGYIFKTAQLGGTKKWLVGCYLSELSPEVKKRLQERANGVGLIDEKGSSYSGGDLVFMIAR